MKKLAIAALLAATAVTPVFAQQTDPSTAAPPAADASVPPPAAAPDAAPAPDAAAPAPAPADTTAAPQAAPADTGAGSSFMGLDTAVGADASLPKTAVGGQTFTGLRGEVFGGWNRINQKYHAGPAANVISQKNRSDGFTGGVLLGYDYPIGTMLVAGPFVSIAGTTAQNCNDRPAGSFGCYKQQAEAEGGARLGVKVGDRTLGYVKGAYVETLYGTTNYSNPAGANNGHAWKDGWRAGAGVEFAVNNHLYTKVEYDYTRTSRFSGAPHGFVDTDLSAQRSEVLAGFGVRF